MQGLILIVDDETDLVNALEYSVQKEGYQTRTALSGNEALEAARKEPRPDLVLLDLMLPDLSGLEVCKRLKASEATRHIPVIMVTARTEEVDRVVGFEIGADDYITKPFSTRELLLRLRAVLRRFQPAQKDAPSLVFGALRIDEAAHKVWVDEERIELTALEFRLLATLLERKGRVQSRDVLLSDVWGIHSGIETRTVDTHVKRLRQKLGPAGDYLDTVRGVGYRFRVSPDENSKD